MILQNEGLRKAGAGTSELVVFTESQLFSFCGRLYRPPEFFFSTQHLLGMNTIQLMLRAHRVEVRKFVHDTMSLYRITCAVGLHFLEVTSWANQLCDLNCQVRVLQRELRAWMVRQRDRRRERQLAVAMAGHWRLGADCPLAELGEDLVAVCARLATDRF
jgi:hypothetical protein